MSTAELTARRIFTSYNIHSLPDEVKRCLAILCISTPSDEDGLLDGNALNLTHEEKVVRAKQALIDAKEGNCCSTEELCQSLDSKYPWLCK